MRRHIRKAPIRHDEGPENFTWTPDFWQRWVDKADPRRRYVVHLLTTRAIELMAARAGERVLNAGCGFGREAGALLKTVPDVQLLALDTSKPMLKSATENLRRWDNCATVQAQIEQLPFSDAHFEKIICLGVMMHVGDEQSACHELIRVLKAGGRMILTFNCLAHPLSLLAVAYLRWSKRGQPGFKQSFRLPAYYSRIFQRAGASVELFPGSFSMGLGPGMLMPVERWMDDHLGPHIPWATYEPILVIQKQAESLSD